MNESFISSGSRLSVWVVIAGSVLTLGGNSLLLKGRFSGRSGAGTTSGRSLASLVTGHFVARSRGRVRPVQGE